MRATFALVESRIHDSRYHGIVILSITNIVLVLDEWAHLFEWSRKEKKTKG